MHSQDTAAAIAGNLHPWVRSLRRSPTLRGAALLIAWLLVWEVGWLVEYTHHASVWFPVAGLTFAALLVIGPSVLPALFAGCILITVLTARHYQIPLSDIEIAKAGALFGIAHLLPYGLGASVLRMIARRSGWDVTGMIIAFLLIAAATALLATALVLSSLVVTGMMQADELARTWLPFWVGDMAGVMVMAPLFVGLLSLLFPDNLFKPTDLPGFPYQPPSRHFVYKLGLIGIFLAASMLLAKVTHSPDSAFAIFFLVIPHMWIACSESPLMNALSVAFSSFLVAFLVHMFQLMEFVLVYQFAITVIAANTLFGLAVPTLLAHNLQLRAATFTDSLTQVATRERLEQRAALEIVRCGVEGYPLSLIVLDIDHFKDINDRLGHSAGDQALQQLCQVARQSLRPADFLGRFGGDEFVVVLPHADQHHAERISARIIEQLSDVRLPGDMPLTASFGVAEWRPTERYETLFMRADRALYEAKLAGRNRVVLASVALP